MKRQALVGLVKGASSVSSSGFGADSTVAQAARMRATLAIGELSFAAMVL